MNKNPDGKLRDIVTDMLYDDIVSLRIAPGTKLNVNQLASSLGISRTPVAEAITRLTEIGFVVTHPGQNGSFLLTTFFLLILCMNQLTRRPAYFRDCAPPPPCHAREASADVHRRGSGS